MKTKYILTAIALALFSALFASAGSVAPLADRQISIPFTGKLADAQGRAFDGTVGVEARYARAATGDASDLLYAEHFTGVEVERGVFRVPLLRGEPMPGQVLSIAALDAAPGIFVTIAIDGQVFLAHHPMRKNFAALRGEHAAAAEGLRRELKLTPDQIPVHAAAKITSETFSTARIPPIPGTAITSGTFAMGQIPSFAADKLTGELPVELIPSSIEASAFGQGVLPDSVISDEVLRPADIGFSFGPVEHNGSVQPPPGFELGQCQWMVSLRRIDGHDGIDQYQLSTRPTGEVACEWSPNEQNTDKGNCTANYLVICKQ